MNDWGNHEATKLARVDAVLVGCSGGFGGGDLLAFQGKLGKPEPAAEADAGGLSA